MAHLVAPERAANIPKFVNLPADAIVRVQEKFLDDYSYTLAGNEFYRQGETDRAIEKFTQALALNPNNAMAHQRLGFLFYNAKRQSKEGMEHLQTAARLEPQNPFAQFDLGMALADQRDLSNAVVHLEESLRILPDGFNRQYNATEMHFALAEVCYRLARYPKCLAALEEVLRRNPNHALANYLTALSKAWLGETDSTTAYYQKAMAREPRLAEMADYFDLLSRNYIKQGAYAEALGFAEKGFELARTSGRTKQAEALRQRLEACRRETAAPGQ